MTCVEMRMRSKRDRQSLRDDKYWQSIWHRQMLFKTKALTSVLSCDRTKEIHGDKTANCNHGNSENGESNEDRDIL